MKIFPNHDQIPRITQNTLCSVHQAPFILPYPICSIFLPHQIALLCLFIFPQKLKSKCKFVGWDDQPPLPHPYHQRLLRPPLRPPSLPARLPSCSRRVQRQTLGVGLQIFLPSVSKDFYPCRVKCPTFGFCLSVRTKTDFT